MNDETYVYRLCRVLTIARQLAAFAGCIFLADRLYADPANTTGFPVQATGTNNLHGIYIISGSGASLTATNGYIGTSGSAAQSGTATYAAFAGSLATEPPYTFGSVSGTITLSASNGILQSGTISAASTLAVPSGGITGSRMEVWLAASGTGQSLALASGIAIPSGSSITFPQELTGGKLYILLLRDTGSEWVLNSFVGGY